MSKVLDANMIAQAFRDAEEALQSGDPEVAAGRFSPVRRSGPSPQSRAGDRAKRVSSTIPGEADAA